MMVSKENPYVCVSGPSTKEEVVELISLFRFYGMNKESEPMASLGFQCSKKVLTFGHSEGNKRMPHINRLPELLREAQGSVFSVLHYYTPDTTGVFSDIARVLEMNDIYSRGLLNGLQLNGLYPSPNGPAQVQKIKKAYPEMKIILQVKPNSASGMAADQAASNLVSNYYENIDYIILDASGGMGKMMDVKAASEAFAALCANGFDKGITFAGGLNGENVYKTMLFINQAIGTNQFSIDVEGGIRVKVGEGNNNDVLVMKSAALYLRGAAEAYMRM
ncbi:MAG: hypothetical protein KGH60_05035 [Candidatus Micrarchaeota archaeon]|nr:hypothetical protein [Candidatus Micrarchaeota archaeon]